MSIEGPFPEVAPSAMVTAIRFTYPAARLAVKTAVGDDRCTVKLAGELDLASRPKLDRALARLNLECMRELLLDLGDVTFMDSSGVHAVMTVKALCAEHGCELLVPSCSVPVRRLFGLTGVLDRLRRDGAIAPD